MCVCCVMYNMCVVNMCVCVHLAVCEREKYFIRLFLCACKPHTFMACISGEFAGQV